VIGIDGADDLQRRFFLHGFAERGACGMLTHVLAFRMTWWRNALIYANGVPARQMQ
jgi:hypothetical protein